MGTVGKQIVNLDVDKLIEKLNRALCDEWLAVYQYWVGAKVVKGILREYIAKELMEHSKEEYKHAEMLVERILQLGGNPILEPKQWYEKTHCGYEKPKDFDGKVILKQNIKGEQCAIKIYKEILELVRGKDDVTFHMILEILKEEIEHEDDLENILEEI